MRFAGALATGRGVRLLAEWSTVGIGRIAGILALVVGVRPLGRVGIARRVGQLVVRILGLWLPAAFSLSTILFAFHLDELPESGPLQASPSSAPSSRSQM